MRFAPLRFLRSFIKSRTEASGPANARAQHALIICHAEDTAGLEIMSNLCAALEFGKIRYATVDLARGVSLPPLDGFTSLVICTERIWTLDEETAARVSAYVYAGGGLLVACRCWSEELAQLFGFVPHEDGPDIHTTSGLAFVTDMFPGTSGLRVDDKDWQVEHSRYRIGRGDLEPACVISVCDLNDQPVAWRRNWGRGRVVYWNTLALSSGALRGFALQSVLATMPVAVSAIAGFAMFQVDDFPTSLSEAKLEPVSTEYPGLDCSGFFFDIWHRDMMELRTRHSLKYTFYTVMNYQDIDNRTGAATPSPAGLSGKEVLKRRLSRVPLPAAADEYGFHGYNHDPLTAEFWPDTATLALRLTDARALWEEAMPVPLPTSWVPANNWYDPSRVKVLREVFPEISVICGYARGDFSLGESREFGPEPWEPALTCLPRETYGYVQKPALKLMMLSQIASMGLWTHFVHPDDVYDVPAEDDDRGYHRNPHRSFWRAHDPSGRPGLYDQFDAWIAEVRSLFPWLDFVTTSEAAARFRAHESLQADILTSGSRLEVRGAPGGLFYVRTDPGTGVVAMKGGEVLDSRDSGGDVLSVIRCSDPAAIFRLSWD